jgi:uncharacterized protein
MYLRQINKPLISGSSFFLFGPRGTGKSTWLREKCPQSTYIDLLDDKVYANLLANPSQLKRYLNPDNDSYVIIDEIQRVPELLNEVHRLIELEKIKFVLTGSSARKLRKKGVNLLAGRALLFHLYPLTSIELDTDFDINNSLHWGHLPAVYSAKNPADFIASYVMAYLKEEVHQEGLTRNLGAFIKFLEIASFSQGSLLNMSEVAREAGLNRKMVENYFSILDDLLIAYQLPVFSKRSKRRLVKHHKFYFFDCGVYRQIRPKGPLDAPEEIAGISLETLVFQELIAMNHYFDKNYELYFWRTSNGVEVDFVLYGPSGIICIEVKYSSTYRSKDLNGLRSFKKDYPMAKAYLFYMGDNEFYEEDVTIMPATKALRTLPQLM